MSGLPFLTATRVSVPRPATHMVPNKLRNIRSRVLTASMPRPLYPVSSQPHPDYLNLERADRISLENKVDDLLRGVPFRTIEPETIPGLIIVVKERRRKSLLSNNHTLSQTLDDMNGRLNSLKLQIKFEAMKTLQIRELQYTIEQSKKELARIIKKWDEKVKQFNAEQDAAAKKLEEEHIEKLQAFDDEIPTELPPKFCKLSSDLLDNMEREKHLILIRQYEEAKRLKKENDRRKALETEEQKKKFLALIEKQRKELIKEQEHAVECFTLRWQRNAEKLNKQKENEISTQQKVIDNYMQDLHDIDTKTM